MIDDITSIQSTAVPSQLQTDADSKQQAESSFVPTPLHARILHAIVDLQEPPFEAPDDAEVAQEVGIPTFQAEHELGILVAACYVVRYPTTLGTACYSLSPRGNKFLVDQLGENPG